MRHGAWIGWTQSWSVVLLLGTGEVRADLAKQHLAYERLILPGGRAALMGGAYTALSSDPSGILYNPAGSVFSQESEISLNTWSQFRSQAVYREAVRGRDFEENSNTRFGGFTGGLFQRKPFTLGYVITTLDKRDINQDDYFFDLSNAEGEVRNFTRIHQESNSYDLFGGSLAVAIGKSWGLGAVVFFYDRSIEAMDYQQVEYNGGQVLVQETKIKVGNQGFLGTLGLSYRGPELSLGLSVKAGHSVTNRGLVNLNSVTHPYDSAVPTVVSLSSNQHDEDEELIPTNSRLGLAWYPNSFFLLSLDVHYSSPLRSYNGTPDREETWNAALGLEIGWSAFKVLGGIFTNHSLFPDIDEEQNGQQLVHLDYLGTSGGLAFLNKSFDIYLGYVQQRGQGRSQIIADSDEIQDVDAILENYVASWNFKLR
jgi:hypothetical protein